MPWRGQLQFPMPLFFLGSGSWSFAFARLLDPRTLVKTITERWVAGSRNLAVLTFSLEQKKDGLLRLLLECFVMLRDEDLNQRLCSFIKPGSSISPALDLGEKTEEPIAVGSRCLCPLSTPSSHGSGRGLGLLICPGDDGIATSRFLPCLFTGLVAKLSPFFIFGRKSRFSQSCGSATANQFIKDVVRNRHHLPVLREEQDLSHSGVEDGPGLAIQNNGRANSQLQDRG